MKETPCIEGCKWIKVEYDKDYVPTVYRWFVYNEYLKNHRYDNILMVDSTDVTMLRNPFDSIDVDSLYCGSEYAGAWASGKFNCDFINERLVHLKALDDLNHILDTYGNNMILNCGIIGGKHELCLEFLGLLTKYHKMVS